MQEIDSCISEGSQIIEGFRIGGRFYCNVKNVTNCLNRYSKYTLNKTVIPNSKLQIIILLEYTISIPYSGLILRGGNFRGLDSKRIYF